MTKVVLVIVVFISRRKSLTNCQQKSTLDLPTHPAVESEGPSRNPDATNEQILI